MNKTELFQILENAHTAAATTQDYIKALEDSQALAYMGIEDEMQPIVNQLHKDLTEKLKHE